MQLQNKSLFLAAIVASVLSSQIYAASSGIVLQPPELNDNPSATLVVNTAGDKTVELPVSVHKCKVDREGLVLRGSCKREFSGVSNREIKVLPGYYLVSAAINRWSDRTTVFSENPIQIHADEMKTLTLKAISIDPTDRLKSVRLGVDYSDPQELLKSVNFIRGQAETSAGSSIYQVNLQCRNSSGDTSCGHERYLTGALQKLSQAHCHGSKLSQENAFAELALNHQKYEILYRGALEIAGAVQQAFAENQILQDYCRASMTTAMIASKFNVTKRYDERVRYEKEDSWNFFFNLTRYAPTINLIRDPATKVVSWSVEEKVSGSDATFDVGRLFLPIEIPITQTSDKKVSTYVFPGTYFVVYEFVGNWDNPTRTLMQTQYGQIVH